MKIIAIILVAAALTLAGGCALWPHNSSGWPIIPFMNNGDHTK